MSDPLTTPIRLPMGSAIPEWLLVAEPAQAGAPRGNFRFAVDVDIIETPNYFAVLPIVAPGSQFQGLIDNTGMFGHRCYAPGKPVITVNVATTWFPVDVPMWNSGPDVPPPPAPTPVYHPHYGPSDDPLSDMMPTPDGRGFTPRFVFEKSPNLWRRLRWAFFRR